MLAVVATLAVATATACSGAPSEETESTASALTPAAVPITFIPAISNIHVSANGSGVTITYARSRLVETPYTVELRGPLGTTSLPESSVNGSTGVVFASLDECTDYDWTIVNSSGTTLASGVVHTLTPTGGLCPTSQKLSPTDTMWFIGIYHGESTSWYCEDNGWNPAFEEYPLGTGWHVWGNPFEGGGPGPYSGFGFEHSYNPGAQPFPCWEQFVEVNRDRFSWTLDAATARRVNAATLEVGFTQQVCSTAVDLMGYDTWPITTNQTDAVSELGTTWADQFGGPVGKALASDGVLGQLTMNGLNGTLDVTASAKAGTVNAGFAANDGFPDYTGLPGIAYAADNNSCSSGQLSIDVATTFAALTPDTPMNCSLQMTCSGYTVTCDPAPEYFELWGEGLSGEAPIQYAVGTTTTGPTFQGDYELSGNVHVCSVDATGTVRTCTAPFALPTLSCSSPPPPPPPATCGGKPHPGTDCSAAWHCCGESWACGVCE